MELTINVRVLVEGLIVRPTPEALEGGLLMGGKQIKDVTLFVTSFADSAPPRIQEFGLADADYDHKFGAMLREQVRRLR